MSELKSFRSDDRDGTIVEVGPVRFGDGSFPVIAGPGAIESPDQILEAAQLVAEGGAALLRADAFTNPASPYTFAGLGEHGLGLLRDAADEVGLPAVSEINEPGQVSVVSEYVDMLQVGGSNMQDFVLLQEVGRSGKPILLRRGASATVDEWLMAAEYILNEGNGQVVMCERGIRTFETRTRHTLDMSAVPVVKGLSHLPVIVDPSHATGSKDLVVPLALAGRAVGADGLMVEVHPEPDAAITDGHQHLDRDGFLALMHALGIARLRSDIDIIDREIVRLLARRVVRAVEIGRIKLEDGIPLRSPDRELDLLADVRAEAERLGLDTRVVQALFEDILDYSRFRQRRDLEQE